MFVLFFFIFYVFCSLAGVYLNCFGRGNLTAFFCKSKDFKAFLRCSCVHFFLCLFFAIITIICNFFLDLQRKNKCVPKGGEDENEEGIHL